MNHSDPPLQPAPALAGADGTRSIAEIAEAHPGVPMVKLGKETIKDAGRRLAQIQGLKPGSSSIRSPEMIEEILTRLSIGETLTSITCDTTMPAISTLWGWCDKDEDLANAIKRAQAKGQRTLADLRLDIAAGGTFSTGDRARDELLIKAINANIAQRNRAEFGEKLQVEHSRVVVNMPDWAVSVASSDPLKIEDNSDNDR